MATVTSTGTARSTTATERVERARPFRSDIQGLRAVAVLAVVAYHVGVPLLTGGYVGVDVFFVISGFLITSHLLGELTRTGTIGLRAFYARRARRLLPAAALVSVATIAATAVVESTTAARRTAVDAVWSSVYGLNIRLARQGTQYSAIGAAPSKLLHFWSLAVEEQYYLVWPLLLLVTAACWRSARRRRPNAGPPLLAVVAVVLTVLVAGSLALSAWQTPRDEPWAYFGLQTRAWELAVGALVAVGAGRLGRLAPRAGSLAAWGGLVALTVAVFTFDDATVFPGTAATLPVLGAALVLAGGVRQPSGVVALLGRRPLQWVGARSYGWYLWHWPAVVLAPSVLTSVPTRLAQAVGAVVGLGLADLSLRLVEDPVRRARWLAPPGRGLGLGAVLSGGVALVGVLSVALLPVPVGRGTAQQASASAAAVSAALELTAAPSNMTPTVEDGAADRPASNSDGCFADIKTARPAMPCVYGDVAAPRTMMLIGDSHADQWLPALQVIAADHGWKILVRTKSNCSIAFVDTTKPHASGPYRECTSFRDAVFAEVARVHPALVVTSASLVSLATHPTVAEWRAGAARSAAELRRSAGAVAFIDDTPNRSGSGVDCVGAHLSHVQSCVTPLSWTYSPHYTEVHRAVVDAFRAGGAQVVDMLPSFCAAKKCPSVIGSNLVYRDNGHITATYMRTLVPVLAAEEPFARLDAGH